MQIDSKVFAGFQHVVAFSIQSTPAVIQRKQKIQIWFYFHATSFHFLLFFPNEQCHLKLSKSLKLKTKGEFLEALYVLKHVLQKYITHTVRMSLFETLFWVLNM